MDDELKAYLGALGTRLDARQDRLEAGLVAMEARLMGRINDVQERMLQGFAAADKRMHNLELAVISGVELQRTTNSLLNLLVANVSELSGRVTRLEQRQ